jgi:hypothetical protein
MGEIRAGTQNELTLIIAGRLRELWSAYVRVDEAGHSALLTREYRAVHPDATVHPGKPSAKEIAAAAIDDYWVTELQAWPVGEEAAIVAYTAEVALGGSAETAKRKLEVGEVWMKEENNWKCRYHHATSQKSE